MLLGFSKPEALQKYIAIMDEVARQHFETCWDFNKQVVMFPLAKHYTFAVACRLFLSIEDPEYIAKFEVPFNVMASGIISLPIDFPGTNYNRAIKAAKVIRKHLLEIIRGRKKDLMEGKVSSSFSKHNILWHILTTTDEYGQFTNEIEVANNIIALLLGGHDTASVAITFTAKYLAELPHVYDQVLKEQTRIASAKKPGELLNWEDIQKMRYSWNVACEVMRLVPPLPGTFRKALTVFKFSGYSVPKGWKLYWTANSTHKDPNYFPEPEKFDPSRFKGNGPAPYTYVPFGGGPRMCPGQEYARVEILVFMYNIVTRFKWEKIIPDENIIVDPLPKLAKGLPVCIYPH